MDSTFEKLEEQFASHSRQDHEDFKSIHDKLDRVVSGHPTNGELALMIGGVATDITEIKIQTTKTNGRVTSLETAKNMAVGGLILTNILLVPVAVALAINYLKQ